MLFTLKDVDLLHLSVVPQAPKWVVRPGSESTINFHGCRLATPADRGAVIVPPRQLFEADWRDVEAYLHGTTRYRFNPDPSVLGTADEFRFGQLVHQAGPFRVDRTHPEIPRGGRAHLVCVHCGCVGKSRAWAARTQMKLDAVQHRCNVNEGAWPSNRWRKP